MQASRWMLRMQYIASMRSIRLPQRQIVEDRYGRPLREVLLDLAYRQHLTQQEIAKRLGVPEGTIHSWFLRERIQAGQLALERASQLLEGVL